MPHFFTPLGFFRSLNRLGMSLDVPEDVLVFKLNVSYHGESNFRFFAHFHCLAHIIPFFQNVSPNWPSNVFIVCLADTWRCRFHAREDLRPTVKYIHPIFYHIAFGLSNAKFWLSFCVFDANYIVACFFILTFIHSYCHLPPISPSWYFEVVFSLFFAFFTLSFYYKNEQFFCTLKYLNIMNMYYTW